MVESHGVDGAELCQIILVRCVVSVPGNHIEWRMIQGALEQAASKLVDDSELAVPVLKPGARRAEVPWICQTIRSCRYRTLEFFGLNPQSDAQHASPC